MRFPTTPRLSSHTIRKICFEETTTTSSSSTYHHLQNNIIRSLDSCTNFTHLKQVHAHIYRCNLNQNSYVLTKLIRIFTKLNYPINEYPRKIFNQVDYPDSFLWTALIRGYVLNGFFNDGFSLYSCMRKYGVRETPFTFCALFKGCTLMRDLGLGFQLHGYLFKIGGFVSDLYLNALNSLIDLYVKNGFLESARKVFDEMPVRDVACWNALICGFAQGSFANEALRLFDGMCEVGLKVDEISVIGALSACSQMGAIKEGDRVWCLIKEEKLDMNVIVCNAVIDMYSKCGFVDKAYDVFRTMICRKNIVTWNTMMMGFAMHGHGVEAIELLNEMDSQGILPDAITYLAVLCACNHAGLVDEGYGLFNSLEAKGVVRNVKHYGTVVDLLGRSGRVNEAYEIIKTMPISPDIVLWQTLLGACNTFGRVELAEIASQKLVEMGSDSSGDFVLLSNVYATYKRWSDVGRVREVMKVRDVKKVPGFSYTEVGGVLHKFINGDQSHPDWREIYRKLDEIMCKIKEHGYVPGTRFVLHDIGEEDKEHVLCYHSEKLAVAYGLLKTSQEMPIQVIKNLRICVDCHAVIKLVSKVYNREIIVRDRARFHKFKDGTCSCRDYW